jgi:HAD superfamily hydrolase (TIGR01490 family)
MNRRAALFDMDRTLVRVETASLYVKYQRDIGEATWRDSVRIAYWVAQYTLGILDAPKVAARAIGTLRGTSESLMTERCNDWVRRYVAQHVGNEARRAVARHKEAGDLTAIVTGASPYAARPVARMLGIDHVVASELETDGAVFTGRPSEPLCYGEGKVVRAKRLAEVHGFRLEDAVFYTDSYTDMPLLLAVGQQVIVNPDPRLRREAKRRGWPIHRW